MNTNTALQVTTYDFYGDELVALRDNATGEIYASINSVLKGIGFTDKNQIRKKRDKWINDSVVSKGIAVFKIPVPDTTGVVPKKDTTPLLKDTYCISQRKLPIALAKISITPTMKKDQPELASKLELYQDKCADVLASVFIDNKAPADLNLQSMYQTMLQPLSDSIATLTNSMAALTALTDCITSMSKDLDELKKKVSSKPYSKKKYSYWTSKMFPKYQALTDYLGISYTELYKNLFNELKNTYPDVDLNQAIDDFCYENRIDSCYTLDVIEHNITLRKLFESIVDETLTKYNLLEENSLSRIPTIFDQSIKAS